MLAVEGVVVVEITLCVAVPSYSGPWCNNDSPALVDVGIDLLNSNAARLWQLCVVYSGDVNEDGSDGSCCGCRNSCGCFAECDDARNDCVGCRCDKDDGDDGCDNLGRLY